MVPGPLRTFRLSVTAGSVNFGTYATGTGVGLTVGVGVTVGVGLRVGVGDTVGVGDIVGVGLRVGVGEFVGVGLTALVGVAASAVGIGVSSFRVETTEESALF